MGIEGFKATWEAQIPELSDRIKANWYRQLAAVSASPTPAAATEAALIAKGYLVGLLDAEAIDEPAASLLGGHLVHIEQDVMARLGSS